MEPVEEGEEKKESKFKYGGPKDIQSDATLTPKILSGKYNGTLFLLKTIAITHL